MAYSKALIVDDSKLARITLKRKIEALGLSVVLAESGRQALEVIASESPDIVFMDHLMPEMDGFEATQALRADPKYVNLPIIMCTGKDHDGYLDEAMAIGANQILSKPPVDDALQALLATEFTVVESGMESIPEITINDLDSDFSLDLDSSSNFDMNISGDDHDQLDDLADDASDDLLADFSSDSLDLGTNVIESAVPKATPIAQPPASPQATTTSGIDEAAVKALLEQAVTSMNAQTSQQFATQKAEISHELEQRIARVTVEIPEANAAIALPEGQVESICKTFFERERISLVAEVLASVPEPEIPEFEVPKIDYDRLDQQLTSTKAELMAVIDEKIQTSQSALIQKIEALLKEKLSSVQAGLAQSDVELIAKAAVNEQASGSGADLQQQLKQREKILLQHLEMNKASIAGLLAEAQLAPTTEVTPSNNTGDLTEEVDILRVQYQQLSGSSASKTLAFVGVGLGVIALALAVFGFIQ